MSVKSSRRCKILKLTPPLLPTNSFATFAGRNRSLEDGAPLHFGDLRVHDREAAAAEAEHRVEFVQRLHAVGDFLLGDAHLLGHLFLALVLVRQELVQRRVEGADGDRVTFHRAEDAGEIIALQRQ